MTRMLLAVAAVCLLMLGFTTGCSPSGEVPEEGIVQIGSTKADLFGLPAEFRAMHAELETLLGRPVRFRAQPGGAALAQQLELGEIHYAILSAAEYAAVKDPSKLTPLASGVNALGQTTRKALLVVKAGSHVKGIADCKGRRFAFGKYGDLLTDVAAQRALEEAGVPVKDLLLELLTPPPIGLEGRLYLKDDAAKLIAADLTVNAGVIDEVVYAAMPETGGNLITGPSKDQFKIVGETIAVPEMVVVAGPAAEAQLTSKFEYYLLNRVKDSKLVCRQLGVTGFAAFKREPYDAVRALLAESASP